jgi:hypothetical protein
MDHNLFFSLPNDVLDIIYEKKIKLELRDVHKHIEDHFHHAVVTLLRIVLQATRNAYWLSDEFDFQPHDEKLIYATLRNTGVIDDDKLEQLIIASPHKPNEPYDIGFEVAYWMNYNSGPSVFQLVKIFNNLKNLNEHTKHSR